MRVVFSKQVRPRVCPFDIELAIKMWFSINMQMDRYERQVEKPTATSPLHQSTLALALDMWLLELGMHISRYISSPSRVQPVPWFKTSSTRKGWGIPVDIESGYPIFHLQPRCKRGIYASGIGTRLVGSKFSQSSGRLRGLGLAYSPKKGGRFDFFTNDVIWSNSNQLPF